jgi:hypothetical protein
MIGIAMALLSAATVSAHDPGKAPSITVEDYARADSFRHDKVAGSIKNASVAPHWIGDGDEFWYKRDTSDGHEFVIVESATGTRRPAFDHEALAAALADATDTEVSASALPFDDFSFGEDRSTIEATTKDHRIECDLEGNTCRAEPFTLPPRNLLPSPNGKFGAFQRDNNLWVRDLETGEERALSSDGAEYYSYGKLPDASLVSIRFRLMGFTPPPYGAVWSPDSSKIVVTRLDERHIKPLPFVQFAPENGNLRPVLHELKYSLTGEEPMKADVFVIDATTRRSVPVKLPEEVGIMVAANQIWWSQDLTHFYVLGNRGIKGDQVALLEVNTATGETRIIIEETTDTHIHLNPLLYRTPNVRVLGGGRQVIWFSERSGWGQLYLYDGATGRLKNPITQGEWLVHDIIHVDEDSRQIFFTAGGREPWDSMAPDCGC